ncbi:uncharacterized protein UDID_17692 [Ustilago sp. UG-2017a]|nr:uncharacterized protein UDID_17692 [Ustilago sp. UG-2017a]
MPASDLLRRTFCADPVTHGKYAKHDAACLDMASQFIAGGHNCILQAPKEDGRGLQCNVGMEPVVQAMWPIDNIFATLAP